MKLIKAICELLYKLLGKKPARYRYAFLGRLENECINFIECSGDKSDLFHGSIYAHITEMKKIYNNIPFCRKPSWITYKDILKYEKDMKEIEWLQQQSE